MSDQIEASSCLSPEPHSSPVSLADTPVGERDRIPKIQLCLEIRERKVTRSKNARIDHILEVTVLYVKYLPKTSQNQLVKLRLHHQLREEILSTDLIPGAKDTRYIEIITFPIAVKHISGSSLQVQVCDKKPTRRTKSIGEVQISLDNLRPNNPVCKWYNLKMSDRK